MRDRLAIERIDDFAKVPARNDLYRSSEMSLFLSASHIDNLDLDNITTSSAMSESEKDQARKTMAEIKELATRLAGGGNKKTPNVIINDLKLYPEQLNDQERVRDKKDKGFDPNDNNVHLKWVASRQEAHNKLQIQALRPTFANLEVGHTVGMVINCGNAHWVSVLVKKEEGGNLTAKYADSTGVDIKPEVMDILVGAGVREIASLSKSQQSLNDCGPAVIANIMSMANDEEIWAPSKNTAALKDDHWQEVRNAQDLIRNKMNILYEQLGYRKLDQIEHNEYDEEFNAVVVRKENHFNIFSDDIIKFSKPDIYNSKKEARTICAEISKIKDEKLRNEIIVATREFMEADVSSKTASGIVNQYSLGTDEYNNAKLIENQKSEIADVKKLELYNCLKKNNFDLQVMKLQQQLFQEQVEIKILQNAQSENVKNSGDVKIEGDYLVYINPFSKDIKREQFERVQGLSDEQAIIRQLNKKGDYARTNNIGEETRKALITELSKPLHTFATTEISKGESAKKQILAKLGDNKKEYVKVMSNAMDIKFLVPEAEKEIYKIAKDELASIEEESFAGRAANKIYKGIGASGNWLVGDGFQIDEVFVDTPAEKMNLQKGDKITKVQTKDGVVDLSDGKERTLEEVVGLIRQGTGFTIASDSSKERDVINPDGPTFINAKYKMKQDYTFLAEAKEEMYTRLAEAPKVDLQSGKDIYKQMKKVSPQDAKVLKAKFINEKYKLKNNKSPISR